MSRRVSLAIAAAILLAIGLWIWFQIDMPRRTDVPARQETDGDGVEAPPAPELKGPAAPGPIPAPETPAPETATASGRLLVELAAKDGGSVGGLSVKVWRTHVMGEPEPKALDTTTDSQGRARLEKLLPGEYWIDASNDGYVPTGTTTNVRAGSQARVRIELTKQLSVTGRVVRAEDGVGVSGAAVAVVRGGSAGGRTVMHGIDDVVVETTTGPLGAFRLPLDPKRIRTLRARAPGLAEGRLSIVRERPGEDVIIRLAPGGTLRGRVLQVDGTPCAKARLFVVPADEPRMLGQPRLVLGPDGSNFWSTHDVGGGSSEMEGEGEIRRARRAQADDEGRFEIGHLALPARVHLLAEGPERNRAGTALIELTSAQPSATREVQLEVRAVLAVHVVDPGDRKVAAEVSLHGVTSADGGAHFLTPRGEGTATPAPSAPDQPPRFPGLALGTYAYTVKGPSGDEVKGEVEIEGPGERTLTVRVKAARVLAGLVVDEKGQPVAEATIQWGSEHAITGADGRFRLASGPDSGDTFTASSRWYAEGEHAVPPEGLMRVVVRPRPVVTGVLVAPEGGESLRDHLWVGESTKEGPRAGTAVVAADGRFRYPVTHHDVPVRLLLVPRGMADVLFGPFTLAPGDVEDVGRVRLDPGRTVRGHVVDEAGAQLSGVSIRIERPPVFGLRDGFIVSVPSATTGPDGAFAVSRLHAGRFAVRASHKDFAPILEEHDGATLRLVLGPPSFIEGALTGPDGKPAAGASVEVIDKRQKDLVSDAWAQTDANGQFRLGPMPAGTYPLRVWRDRQQTDLEATVGKGATKRLEAVVR